MEIVQQVLLCLYGGDWCIKSVWELCVFVKSSVVKKLLMMLLRPSVNGQFHAGHADGSKSKGRWCMMSVPRR
jgi:hypothetical protein